MRVLRVFLWVLLATCGMWASIIFIGPSLITSAIDNYSKGRVVVSGLEISPKLKMSASLVQFLGEDYIPQSEVQGELRGVDLDWSFNDGFLLFAKIGSARTANSIAMDNSSIRIRPISLTDWSEAYLSGELNNLKFKDLRISLGQFTAKFDLSQTSLLDIKIWSRGHQLSVRDQATSFEEMSIEINEVLLKQPIDDQDLNFSINFPSGGETAYLDISKADLVGSLFQGVASFSALLNDVTVSEIELKISGLELSSQYDLGNGILGPRWQIEATDIKTTRPELELSSYRGTVEANDFVFEHSGQGEIKNMSVIANDMFLADLSNAGFSLEISSGLSAVSGVTAVDTNVRLVLDQGIEVNTQLQNQIAANNLADCIVGACALLNFEADYVINVLQELLIGSSACSKFPCVAESIQHRLQTNNTNALMQNLSQIGIFNPIALSLGYLALRRGIVNGSGHILDL